MVWETKKIGYLKEIAMKMKKLVKGTLALGFLGILLAAPTLEARDWDNNPPGPVGGRGTNWENPPGWRGGPGASPNRHGVWRAVRPRYYYRPIRIDRDNNPPGPIGGRGTNWENPPGPRGGWGASPNRR